jgi:hypothetical protein
MKKAYLMSLFFLASTAYASENNMPPIDNLENLLKTPMDNKFLDLLEQSKVADTQEKKDRVAAEMENFLNKSKEFFFKKYMELNHYNPDVDGKENY